MTFLSIYLIAGIILCLISTLKHDIIIQKAEGDQLIAIMMYLTILLSWPILVIHAVYTSGK